MKKIMVILLIGIIFPIKVNALDGNIELNCDNEAILPGSSVNCTIKVNNFSDEISSFHAKLLLGENLKLESIEKDSSWEGSAEGGIIDLYTDVNKSGDINISSFVVKVDNASTMNRVDVSLIDVKVGDPQFTEHKFNDVSTSVEVIIDGGSNENEPDIEENPDLEVTPDSDLKPDDSTETDKGNNESENNVDNPVTGGFKISVVLLILFISLASSIIIYRRKINNI